MNPLSILTYYRRHTKSTLLLLALVALMTLGVSVMVRLPDSFLEHMAYSESIVTRVDLVSAFGRTLDPGLVAQIRAYPGVTKVIQERGLSINLPPISGDYHFSGVAEGDMQALLDACDLRLKEGRLPQSRTNEIVLSESIARGIGKWVGDEIGRSRRPRRSQNQDGDTEEWFNAIPAPLVIVGILEDTLAGNSVPSPPLGMVSYEYVNSHEEFVPIWSPGLVIFTREENKSSVEGFLEAKIAPYSNTRTYRQLDAKLTRVSNNFHWLFGVVDVLVTLSIALVVGIINRLAQSKRLTEFGLLNAIGFDKRRLVRRQATETAVVAMIGWVLGLGLAWGSFYLLKTKLYEPHGVRLNLANLTPIWFTLPIPLATIAYTVLNTRRTFARLDSIAIVERGKLSTETGKQKANHSLTRPLGFTVFYLRHRRRGKAIVFTIGLMFFAVAFPAFVFGPMMDAWSTISMHLHAVTVISPVMQPAIDPGVVAQIRGHETVRDVIPVTQVQIEVNVPPMAHPSVSIYGISDDDLSTLLEVYDVHIEAGRLPEPRTNEVVLSGALAQNRGLSIGDRLGHPIDPKEDTDIPTEMIVVGILSALPDNQDLWAGFASFQYMRNHEFYATRPVQLLTIPVQGRKAEMDTWLEETIATNQVAVRTYERERTNQRIGTFAIMIIIGIIESVVAVVAAVALAILSYTFFIQRKQEFGVLHAIGYGRGRLVRRVFGETVSVIAIAWLIGAVLCGIGLIGMQLGLYAPKGFALNPFNPAPWLFTLPLPLTVVIVGAFSISYTLRKLDPVAIIERR